MDRSLVSLAAGFALFCWLCAGCGEQRAAVDAPLAAAPVSIDSPRVEAPLSPPLVGGRVVDLYGAPLVGVRVLVRVPSDTRPLGAAQTDQRGEFEILGTSAAEFLRIEIRSPQCEDYVANDVPSGSLGRLLTVRRRTMLHGRVLNADSSVPAQLELAARFTDLTALVPEVRTTTSADGSFDFVLPRVGTYELLVEVADSTRQVVAVVTAKFGANSPDKLDPVVVPNVAPPIEVRLRIVDVNGVRVEHARIFGVRGERGPHEYEPLSGVFEFAAVGDGFVIRASGKLAVRVASPRAEELVVLEDAPRIPIVLDRALTRPESAHVLHAKLSLLQAHAGAHADALGHLGAFNHEVRCDPGDAAGGSGVFEVAGVYALSFSARWSGAGGVFDQRELEPAEDCRYITIAEPWPTEIVVTPDRVSYEAWLDSH